MKHYYAEHQKKLKQFHIKKIKKPVKMLKKNKQDNLVTNGWNMDHVDISHQ